MSLMLRTYCVGLSWYLAATAAVHAQDSISPLQTVMDGRSAAANSTLNEAGLSTMAQQAANITLYVCGALSIILTAMALVDIYNAQTEEGAFSQGGERKRAALWKLAIAGLVMIPAIIAAVLPYALLGEA